MDMQPLDRARSFLKDHIRQEIDFQSTDQSQGVPPPPIEKPCPPDAKRIPLPPRSEWTHVGPVDLVDAIARRQSHRRFRPDPLHLDELDAMDRLVGVDGKDEFVVYLAPVGKV